MMMVDVLCTAVTELCHFNLKGTRVYAEWMQVYIVAAT